MRLFFSGPRVFGIRPGVSFRPEELFNKTRTSRSVGADIDGSFVYALRGDHNMTKIGVSTNPDARLAQLRTASAFPIEYAFVGVTPGTGYDIEREAHAALANRRVNGEWFDAPPEMAVAAIHGAAFKLKQPIQALEPWMVSEVIRLAKSSNQFDLTRPTHTFETWIKYIALFMMCGAVISFMIKMELGALGIMIFLATFFGVLRAARVI